MTLTCQQCKHVWIPRKLNLGRDKPMKCPNCQSPEWEKKS